ncbi:MAG: hypothetical protein A2826_03200 [Candidatus Doudnabacteria bacterium RIFCSPHIGHO2_01_FULL_43_23]|uniref:Uncharacterized protein n=1 Tax=Candidatus Doudnabacteria bacterium RIFCSPHIGHO2_01_FULL_43_23 TaxID=1817822 RepID=A0A1F5NS84_9BACT|nr:MAG: hypothetical protein A2826_03200 [Candidatus Doudnabacteria bacterium RIFCSPHIGHO2_01_FULL_43_23]
MSKKIVVIFLLTILIGNILPIGVITLSDLNYEIFSYESTPTVPSPCGGTNLKFGFPFKSLEYNSPGCPADYVILIYWINFISNSFVYLIIILTIKKMHKKKSN